ncbi:MFS transporter [Leifsonia sp. AG29]|uniref:MFS transporter n=1 Tax=Leifsonia sp. AG29 TaxID=2598860 RepID=UPI00131B73BE|nr:MFS transporter [Leifsonia sp. AG29]
MRERSALTASRVVFAASGVLVASWTSRIPQASAHLGLSPAQLGAVLFTQAAGGIVAAPLAGMVVSRVGTRKATLLSGLVLGTGLACATCGTAVSLMLTVVGLVVFGAGVGVGDVAMSVHVAALEQRTNRSLLPQAYGWFGLGSVAGAAGGAARAAGGVTPLPHLLVVAVLAAGSITVASRFYLRSKPPSTRSPRASLAAAPPRSRTAIALACIAAAFAVAESAGSNWIGVSITRDHAEPALTAGIAYGCLVGTVTLVRLVMPLLLRNLQLTTVLRASTLVGILGVVLVSVAATPALQFVAAVVWGAGVALGIPTALQLAGRDPRLAAARISTVTTAMYIAYLAAPPAIGFLAGSVPTPVALLVVIPLLGAAAALTGMRGLARPVRVTDPRRPTPEHRLDGPKTLIVDD